jgi:TusE/DsrC/DsvC family sulfur relay protein
VNGNGITGDQDMQSTMQSLRDTEGYVVDPEDWSPDIAGHLATEEDLELTPDYWPILEFMRAYWVELRVAPDVRHVIEYLVTEQGYEKKAAKKHLFDLFPYGYVKQACKIAGMQRPRAWSTG